MTGFTAAERTAMSRALTLAQTSGVPLGPNPLVGCVLLAPDGTTVAEGFHRGAGGPHAEVDALAQAGDRARGSTAVVTLEPCNHTGRTGPCAQALVEAGVARVVDARPTRTRSPPAGRRTLRAAGIDVASGLMARRGPEVNRVWTFAHAHAAAVRHLEVRRHPRRPDRGRRRHSRWITSHAARRDVHRLRGRVRRGPRRRRHRARRRPRSSPSATTSDGRCRDRQPLRVVMGLRDVPADRPGSATTPPRPSSPARTERTRAQALGRAARAATAQPCCSRAARRWPGRSSPPAWSTRSSATSRRSCSAPAAPRGSATWESPPSPTPIDLDIADVTRVGDGPATTPDHRAATRRPPEGRRLTCSPESSRSWAIVGPSRTRGDAAAADRPRPPWSPTPGTATPSPSTASVSPSPSATATTFTADVMGETLRRSALGVLSPGSTGQPGAGR